MYESEVTEIEKLINSQNRWRKKCINLIASENVVSRRVQSQAGSDFAHRYAEGHPGERYYRGTSYIDEIENRLKTNLKIMFECDHSEVRPRRILAQDRPWGFPGVFQQPPSGHPGPDGMATYEMMEFGEQYAEDTIKNAKALAAALDSHGFDVQGKEFAYTESHQVAVNVKAYRGGERVSKTLELNDIILNMNMLPHEPLRNHDRPDGIRIGVQEMTRFGMDAKAMGRIAELIKECIMDKKPVKEEVNRFRAKYRKIKYSCDGAKEKKTEPASPGN